jgi:hypothetical protein
MHSFLDLFQNPSLDGDPLLALRGSVEELRHSWVQLQQQMTDDMNDANFSRAWQSAPRLPTAEVGEGR